MNHYKAKKQLLQESQEQVAEMQRSLDVKEKIGTEFKLLQLDFETVKSNEKNLLSRVTSLEAQVGTILEKAFQCVNKQNLNWGNTWTKNAVICYLQYLVIIQY